MVNWNEAPPWAVCHTTDGGGSVWWNVTPHWHAEVGRYSSHIWIGLHTVTYDESSKPMSIEKRPPDYSVLKGTP